MKPSAPSKPGSPKKPLKPLKSIASDNNGRSSVKESSKSKQVKKIILQDDTDFDNQRYIRHHKPFILKQSVATMSNLQPGHVIKFSYTSKYSPTYKAFPRPSILVLNPNYQGKMHGLALRFLNANQLRIIKQMVKSRNRLNQKVNMNDPFTFYHNNVKRILRRLDQNVYRTYFVSHVSRVILLSFKFD